ncbi:MAG: aminomethyltransferase family protein [Syntrophotaleaceae bacterium]
MVSDAKKKSALHGWHVAHGARMAAFAGYDMPLWYPAGARAEHLAPILNVGLFDTSHMAVLLVKGAGARQLLQKCFSRDLERCIGKGQPLLAGRCTYGFFLDDRGHVIDDAILYQLHAEDYMLVANAGMGETLAGHLRRHAGEGETDIRDLTDRVANMAVQGPASARLVRRLIRNPDQFFHRLVYFSFKGGLNENPPDKVEMHDGTPLIIARTGYTGEFGFEFFVSREDYPRVWETVLAAGLEFQALPCGLAARDSLRVGALLPLARHDVGDWPFAANPWLFALPWDDARAEFTKAFIGADALLSLQNVEPTLPFAGFDPRKIAIGPDTQVTDLQGRPLGQVLTCATDMAIDRIEGRIVSIATPAEKGRPENFTPKGLSCGFIRVNRPLEAGKEVELTDGKRRIRVEIREDIRPDRTARRPMAEML